MYIHAQLEVEQAKLEEQKQQVQKNQDLLGKNVEVTKILIDLMGMAKDAGLQNAGDGSAA